MLDGFSDAMPELLILFAGTAALEFPLDDFLLELLDVLEVLLFLLLPLLDLLLELADIADRRPLLLLYDAGDFLSFVLVRLQRLELTLKGLETSLQLDYLFILGLDLLPEPLAHGLQLNLPPLEPIVFIRITVHHLLEFAYLVLQVYLLDLSTVHLLVALGLPCLRCLHLLLQLLYLVQQVVLLSQVPCLQLLYLIVQPTHVLLQHFDPVFSLEQLHPPVLSHLLLPLETLLQLGDPAGHFFQLNGLVLSFLFTETVPHGRLAFEFREFPLQLQDLLILES